MRKKKMMASWVGAGLGIIIGHIIGYLTREIAGNKSDLGDLIWSTNLNFLGVCLVLVGLFG